MPISTMSRMRGYLLFAQALIGAPTFSAGVVVGRFDRHRDVVRMALLEARRSDLHELRLLQVLDGGRTGVAHRRAQAAGELVDHRRQRPTERYPALDSLRHQLVLGERVVLEVAVLGVRPAST